jgi:REP element-mobilizing transposase RayT
MNEDQITELIDLQSAHVTQHTNEGIRGDWKICKNITSDHIYTLPKFLNDEQVFSIMNFARKYELIAFNEGIKFQKNKQNLALKEIIKNQEKQLEEFAQENIRLATILEQTLEGGE